jgi:NADH-quinone oxidoreductase subunit J
MPPIVFIPLALVAAVSALFMVTGKNPISSAIALAVCLVALAGIFAGLSAHFLFAIQLLVYAGAIVVIVLFVIMLLNLREQDLRTEGLNLFRGTAAIAGGLVAFGILAALASKARVAAPQIPAGFGEVRALSRILFSQHVLPFEVVSLVLLVAIVGSVVLAKRHF